MNSGSCIFKKNFICVVFPSLMALSNSVCAVVPGCEGYYIDANEIYISKHPDRAVIGRSYLFESQSTPLLTWKHGVKWKLLYFTPPSTSTVTQTRTSSIKNSGESDIHLVPSYRGINFVSVADTNDDFCDNATFLAINPPTISVSLENKSFDGGYAYGDFYMSGTMDQQYAINAVAGLPMKFQIQRKDVSKWNGVRCDVVEETSTWQNAMSLSYQTTYNYVERCDTLFRFRSYDGEFFSDWTSFLVIGGSTGSIGGSSSGGSGSGGSGSGGSGSGGSGSGGSGSGGSGSGGGSCNPPICSIEP